MWRGLETGSRRTYTGTKLETADTAKGSLRSTAPVLDPTVGALTCVVYGPTLGDYRRRRIHRTVNEPEQEPVQAPACCGAATG
jgi:hypothetical protein